ncbi:hypothetical protein DY000_02034770 [Brassica cretica]|uniref:Uncharacterized protein n=1 Tax=Brassica cretica TaxID=69181 RepID=A0ABQ7DYX8_BRACR|nr:hypothetical protein DY000_02034770 [Brassica cretica]
MTGAWYRSAGLQECHLQDFATDSFSATFNTVTGPPSRVHRLAATSLEETLNRSLDTAVLTQRQREERNRDWRKKKIDFRSKREEDEGRKEKQRKRGTTGGPI